MILLWRILPPDNFPPENSSLEKKIPGGGKFFAGAFFAGAFSARMILRRKVLR
jgi:hypothetical protein